MHWNAQDVQQFEQQKQFIDTAIVPALKIDGSAFRQGASEAKFILTLANTVESQFRGRALLMPPLCAPPGAGRPASVEAWKDELARAGFRHVVLLTADLDWPECEGTTVLKAPAIPLDSMDEQLARGVLADQVRHLVPQLAAVWANG